ncbi:hypothetical protein F0562_001437 [Nyssa sinensis]|uniref:Malectin-like domain-containing protein n=1 Tax=Nyssa sinensis TaxID=561372 RepID=A0A5J5C2B3_9ASTE|nr:hypothetical protein F0562_001437 [Nyssa sinensis]
MATHFLFLVSAFLVLSVSADVSIDCGSTDFYTDENSIVWMGDNDIIQNGVIEVVQPSNSISHVMDSLRVFPTRKKNCYAINVDKGEKILVRASFYYGNYDKKSSPPTFDLQFDGNDWATVVTSNTEVASYEAIYVTKGEVASVCVAQTMPDQFPFISALELRSLSSDMYSLADSNHALFTKSRVAYGSNVTIRYSDDFYDRIWIPALAGNGLLQVTSDFNPILINVSTGDNPPQAVLQNAITTSSTSQKRSFRVLRNNQSISDPILPPYGGVSEWTFSNITASSSTTFSLVATADSTLPPLINAMEVFYINLDKLTDGTNSNDVDGLVALQNEFAVLLEWSGDPCLPAPYSWDWINCSNDSVPRVTALFLSSFGLSGALPDFSSMNALQTIDLHNNSLYGPIPDLLGTLPNLKQLNLADNQFSGSIPTSLSKNNNLNLVVTGNPDLCTSGKSCQTTDTPTSSGYAGSGKKKSNNLPAILGATIPSFLVFWAIVGVLAILHHKRRTAAVAAMSAGPNRPTGAPQGTGINMQMAGKIGQAVIHEFKVNMEEQVNEELADQINQQAQDAGYNDSNT